MDASETPEVLVREARALDGAGLAAQAIAAYERILARWPHLTNCWYSLAVLQRRIGQFSAALASYQQALDRGVSKPEEVHLNRGVIYADCLRQDEAAERELAAALALNPAYVPALINLATLHEDLGRREAALAAYERILELDANDAEALARYANLHTFAGIDDPLIGRLRRSLAEPSIGAAGRASLGFALGRALDACGQYTAAFDAYRAANAHSRDSAGLAARYDRPVEERFIPRIIAAFPSAYCAPVASGASAASPRPIFVCGMFRSGSTLVEQLLGGHPRITPGGELDLLPVAAQQVLAPFPEGIGSLSPQRLESLAASYLHRLEELFPGAQFVTDKRPDNFVYIGLIKRLFPDAKIVHTVRDPLDNCLSIFFLHLDQRMNYALDLMDTGHHYRQYLKLMAHWKALFGADILDVNYDDLVREPRPAAEKLLAFLGLEWDERCLSVPPSGRAIKTASVWQVREPIHVRSSGRARHYAREVAGLNDYLNRELERQGRG